jgi:hypothetical protein
MFLPAGVSFEIAPASLEITQERASGVYGSVGDKTHGYLRNVRLLLKIGNLRADTSLHSVKELSAKNVFVDSELLSRPLE